MFTQAYNIFTEMLGYLSPIWSILTTKVRDLGLFQPQEGFVSDFLNGLWEFSVGWWTGISQTSVYDAILNAFGDYSLLEFALGASVTTLISYYVVKFAMGLIG